MRKQFKVGLLFAVVLYLPFLLIIKDPRSHWWCWFSAPGWPVQIIHSNDTFAAIAGTILSFVIIGVFSWFSAGRRIRVIIASIILLVYAIGSAMLMQTIIHAG